MKITLMAVLADDHIPDEGQLRIGLASHSETKELYVVYAGLSKHNVPGIVLGRYRHYKDNEYHVLGVAHDLSDGGELVVYVPKYSNHGVVSMAVRPYDGPNGFVTFITGDDRKTARFLWIGN